MSPSTAAARRSSARAARSAHAGDARRAPSRRPPRRVSGPLRLRPAAATAGAAGRAGGLPLPRAALPRLGARLRALPDHRLLHRLIGGRAWIPVVALALIGIVALQVSLLRLNSQIGRSVARESVLERQNAALRAGNARLSDEQRVRQLAARSGLVNPGTGSIRFLRVGAGDARRAVRRIEPPTGTSPSTLAAVTTPTTSTTTPGTTGVPVSPAAAVTPAPTSSTPTATTPAATTPTTTAPTTTTTTTTPAPAATAPTTTSPPTTATTIPTTPPVSGTTTTTAPAASGAPATGTATATPSVSTPGGAGTP